MRLLITLVRIDEGFVLTFGGIETRPGPSQPLLIGLEGLAFDANHKVQIVSDDVQNVRMRFGLTVRPGRSRYTSS